MVSLRPFLRRYFTRVVRVTEPPIMARTTRRPKKGRQRARRSVVVPPSEKFVWGMIALMIALAGSIVLEAIYIIVVRDVSTELLTIISGLVGSFTTAFLVGYKR